MDEGLGPSQRNTNPTGVEIQGEMAPGIAGVCHNAPGGQETSGRAAAQAARTELSLFMASWRDPDTFSRCEPFRPRGNHISSGSSVEEKSPFAPNPSDRTMASARSRRHRIWLSWVPGSMWSVLWWWLRIKARRRVGDEQGREQVGDFETDQQLQMAILRALEKIGTDPSTVPEYRNFVKKEFPEVSERERNAAR